MKIANVKSFVAKLSTVGLVAAACVLTSPAKANAQVGLRIEAGRAYYLGRPVVVETPYAYGYTAPHYDRYEWERRQEYLREQERQRYLRERLGQERFAHERYDREHFDRDHFDRDHDDHARYDHDRFDHR